MGVVIKSGCGFHVWSSGNPLSQNPAYGPGVVRFLLTFLCVCELSMVVAFVNAMA